MLKDSVDYVRQGACIAMALIMLQQPEDDVAVFRKHLETTIGDKHEDPIAKMGAIMAAGILDASAPPHCRPLPNREIARSILPALRFHNTML